MNYAAIAAFVQSKLIPAISAITTQIPKLLSTTEPDVQAALNAIAKVIADLQTDFTTLAAAVKAA